MLILHPGGDDPAKLAEEQKKLDNNVAIDAAEAGGASTAVSFDATIGSGTAAADDGAVSFSISLIKSLYHKNSTLTV